MTGYDKLLWIGIMEDTMKSSVGESRPARQSRRAAPRLGAFVTIAAALLLLFGAASRVGKVEETLSLFGVDRMAEERIRQEEERLRTALMIGSVPVSRDETSPPSGSVKLDPNAQPPTRGNFDIERGRGDSGSEPAGEGMLSLSIPHNYGSDDDVSPMVSPSMPVPNQRPDSPAAQQKMYRVKNGDTWVKVAKHNLGDANRWREIFDLNPAAQSGLRVGMDLAIPPAR